jgi:hypothetical protein
MIVDRGVFYMDSWKPLRAALVMLLIVAWICATGCSGAGAKLRQPSSPHSEAAPDVRAGADESTSPLEDGLLPQGGSLFPDGPEEPEGESAGMEDTSSRGDEGEAAAPEEKADESLPESRRPDYPQFNRQDYETLQPTEEEALRVVEGFFIIEGAEYIPDESSMSKGERFEVYSLLFRMPVDYDYWEVVDTYSTNIDGKFTRKDWSNDSGNVTCFRVIERNWNKVISIYRDEDNPYIDIRVMFRRLYED